MPICFERQDANCFIFVLEFACIIAYHLCSINTQVQTIYPLFERNSGCAIHLRNAINVWDQREMKVLTNDISTGLWPILAIPRNLFQVLGYQKL